jgi:hypothetical protein
MGSKRTVQGVRPLQCKMLSHLQTRGLFRLDLEALPMAQTPRSLREHLFPAGKVNSYTLPKPFLKLKRGLHWVLILACFVLIHGVAIAVNYCLPI